MIPKLKAQLARSLERELDLIDRNSALHRLPQPNSSISFGEPTRVLVRPIGLDMVEVGGSNPPGPTKRETLAIGGGFSFKGYAEGDRRQRFDNMRLQEHVDRQSAAKAPRRDEGARGKRARNNPPGPTKRGTLAIGGGNRAKP